MPVHPTAPKRPHEIIQHGQTRIDEYYWMRYREDPAVLEYLQAENDYLKEVAFDYAFLLDRLIGGPTQ